MQYLVPKEGYLWGGFESLSLRQLAEVFIKLLISQEKIQTSADATFCLCDKLCDVCVTDFSTKV